MSVRYFRFITLVLMILSLGWTANTVLAGGHLSRSESTPSLITAPADQSINYQQTPVVNAVLFWSQSCGHCHYVIDNVLPPLKEQYGDQFKLLLVEMQSQEDWNLLAQTAAQYGISRGGVGVPFLVIGDRVLIGSGEIPAELPGLIETHLANGGLGLPDIPGLQKGVAYGVSGAEICEPGTDCAETTVVAEQGKADGYDLAVAIMGGMGIALAFVGINAARHFRGLSTTPMPGWLEYATPVLGVVGLGVALYMAYVETQAVEAVCGPVGDCNAVQSSEYAKLFGVLPIGVLGAIGYVAILAAWFWSRFRTGQIARQTQQAVLAMTVFGTLFSLYLTYLEPFVIKAVCAWCLTSAVIITLLMLVNTTPTLQTVPIKRRRRRR